MQKKYVRWQCVFTILAACQFATVLAPPLLAGSHSFFRDYSSAMAEAKANAKLLLIAFHEPGDAARWEELLSQAESLPNGKHLFAKHVVTLLPTDFQYERADTPASDTTVNSQENANTTPPPKASLLAHPSFAEMLQRPGLAVLDFTDANSPLFQYVISVVPISDNTLPTVEHTLILLNLPLAPLTQRSLIFAVRTHPSKPQSTIGDLSPILAQEAESHANYQASINLQGHHHWETRFHRINAKLTGGLHAQEVCAESWPRQTLMESARECVHSWSQSPGHWNAVSGKHPLFGYDMKRGTNGIWYGVGIFGRRD